jgi:hyaluronan synthase
VSSPAGLPRSPAGGLAASGPPTPFVERRRFARRRLDAEASVELRSGLERGRRLDALLIEASPAGLLLRCGEPVRAGDRVTVRAGSEALEGAARGRITHCREGGLIVVAVARGRAEQLHRTLDLAAPWLAGLLLALVVVEIVYLKSFNVRNFWYNPLTHGYALLVSAYIVSRCVLSWFYRPPGDSGARPTVTVVVAAKNEEASIARTLRHVFDSRYPADRLQVIAVDDGSTDGTHAEMERMRMRHPSLQVVRFERNRGKRHAMAEGARLAHGEILVFVDSDSFLEPDAIARLAAAFADPELGAACGHARVANPAVNVLTRMQEVHYYVAFRVVKAAESLFHAVTCCSGCLAAYRRSYLVDSIDGWLNQRFLGRAATFGDDRSLTNLMLRRWKVVYCSEAVCSTIVPETWPVFLRQQLRWKKSWIRESLRAAAFMWKRHPLAAVNFYLGILFPFAAPFVVFGALVLPLFTAAPVSSVYVLGALLMSSLYGLVYLARHRNRYWIYGVAYAFVVMFVLAWQTYYALITVRRGHWGTR